MTKAAAPALIISTKAERSGEISLPDGMQHSGRRSLDSEFL